MNTFLVWYVLSVVYLDPQGLHNELFVYKNLPDCQHAAQRALAALPTNTAKWACHEMTVETRVDGSELVTFPE